MRLELAIQRLKRGLSLALHVSLVTMRYSLLTSAATLILSHLGVGKYLISSLEAIDMRIAAQVESARTDTGVLVVAISDAGFQRYFGGVSPLNQSKLAELLRSVRESAPEARRLLVDLDLSPGPGVVGAAALETELRLDAKRWVLASAAPATPALAQQQSNWRERLCQAGVSFANPLLPTDFGYVRPTQQYRNSLADVAANKPSHCESATARPELQAATLSPHELNAGIVLAFDGDLQVLQEQIRALSPRWIVIGGNWGHEDVFLTPFGDRFGVQVHAAALASEVQGERQAPYGVQVLVSWLFVSLASFLAARLNQALRGVGWQARQSLPGHRFFDTSVRPAMILSMVLLFAAAMAYALAQFWGRSGIWLPSSMTVLVLLSTVMLAWNWGRDDIPRGGKLSRAWKARFASPVLRELRCLRAAARALAGGARPGVWGRLSRPRILFELLMTLASLAFQTVLPALALGLTLAKSL